MLIERINEDIKYYLSKIILEDVKLKKDLAIVTITSVSTTKDLKHAKIYISIFGTKYINQTFEELKKQKGSIKKKLATVLKARNIPDIEFKLDDSMEYGSHMNKVIEDLKK